jgi:TolB-like protein
VHLGEVIIDGTDRLGHGVNVAARLREMAPPGGVVISDTVKTQLRGEIDAEFAPCGRVRLKKMREKVSAFEYIPGASLTRLRWRRWRKIVPYMAAAFVLAIVALAGMRFVETTKAETPFVAVLPFDNLSGDSSLNYFSEGISTEIQATLAQYLDGMRVAGLASSFQFHGPQKDPAHVRKAMGATHVVDGSVRRDGDKVRIVAELVDARTDSVLWTETYDGPVTHTLDIQAEIARRVGALLDATSADIASPPANMPQAALEHYLHAVDAIEGTATFGGTASSDADQAAEHLEAATQSAPQFARAWALLSYAYAAQSRWRNEDEQAALIQRARNAARKALTLDPHSSLAEALLGRVEPEWNWEERRKRYRRALALAPNDARVLAYWKDLLRRSGREWESGEITGRIFRLDPLSRVAQNDVVVQLLNAHDPQGAVRETERLTALNESSAFLWGAILNDRENANDLAGARRALGELERHSVMSERGLAILRHEVELLSHGPIREADVLKLGQTYYDKVTGPGVGQGCVTDEINHVASLDRFDLAWRMAETLYIDRGYVGTTDTCARPVYPARQAATWPLFGTLMEPMQRDPRIWRIFDAVGLTRYWRETNEWPDFCAEPGLPYDCRKMAAARR